jgi:hypothetical protein
MYQEGFGDTAFQYGTHGLHGCTMVAVVSRRAVWIVSSASDNTLAFAGISANSLQAHFWEIYSHGRRGTDGLSTSTNARDTHYQAFRQRVIDAFRGQPVTAPVTNGKPYVPPFGDAIDPSLFNQEGDGTRIIVMTPNFLGSRPGTARYGQQRYSARNQIMINDIIDHIGGENQPRVDVFIYSALNYRNAQQYAMRHNTRRGMCVFQYDPDSDGNGQRAWRLFYEDQMYSGLV